MGSVHEGAAGVHSLEAIRGVMEDLGDFLLMPEGKASAKSMAPGDNVASAAYKRITRYTYAYHQRERVNKNIMLLAKCHNCDLALRRVGSRCPGLAERAPRGLEDCG